ncbi:hypothetical protein [Patiriisocius hiemis]|uniref:Lipoprotein n=1 Tax=Patiriisocius hiemis TaxID=3075604 RepID=A0ABU2YAI7_9FLAO|nr:hypothetical protein [Constantimarinum sp. W242]MDT0555200.1 hypothetical protein [Constantimarinum sp. W242]
MKLPYFLTILFLFLFFGCNTKTKKEKETIKEVTEMVKEKPKTKDFRERLEATSPASEKQLQSILPTTLGGLKRIEFTKSRISQNDIASAGAIYTDGTNKKIEVSIVDGASKDGLLAINTHYMAQTLELNSVKSSGHEKTYEKNGLKVLETYVKKDEFYRVSFLYDMRFGVTLETHKVPREALEQIIEQLNLNKLKNL